MRRIFQMTIQVIGILGLFVLMVVLMMTRKLPTILALPIMAVGIALIAGIPFMGGEFSIAKDVLEAGAMRMSTAIADCSSAVLRKGTEPCGHYQYHYPESS